jgi:GTP cyclohydrolase I
VKKRPKSLEERAISDHIRHVIQILGLDLDDPNLADTPKRIARMYRHDFFSNVGKEFEDFAKFPNDCGYDQIIVFDNIEFTSICSHHFLPFTGLAWLLYIPKEHLIGASKPARLIRHYSARPQLQERLCHEVINSFTKGIKPKAAMVYMRAVHGCMTCRGVRTSGGMGNSAIYGLFRKDRSAKMEALELIKLSMR